MYGGVPEAMHLSTDDTMLMIAFEHNDSYCIVLMIMQNGAVCIPQKVSAYDALFSTLATPKSAAVEKKNNFPQFSIVDSPSLILLRLSRRIFSGLISLWMIFFTWQLYTA